MLTTYSSISKNSTFFLLIFSIFNSSWSARLFLEISSSTSSPPHSLPPPPPSLIFLPIYNLLGAFQSFIWTWRLIWKIQKSLHNLKYFAELLRNHQRKLPLQMKQKIKQFFAYLFFSFLFFLLLLFFSFILFKIL